MIDIKLQADVVAALSAQARAEGLTLEAFLVRLAASRGVASPPIMTDELERLLDEASVPGPDAASTYSRSEIYCDQD